MEGGNLCPDCFVMDSASMFSFTLVMAKLIPVE